MRVSSRSRTPRVAVALLLAAAAWSAGWWGAAALAERQLDGWLSREAADGRRWTCPDRTVEGFPVALTLRCLRPTFLGEVAGHNTDGGIERLEAEVGLAHPATAVVTLHGPLTLRARDDAFLVALSWAALDIAVPLRLGIPTDASVKATRLAVSGSAPGRGEVNVRAGRLSLATTAVPAAPADRRFTFALAGITFPTQDTGQEAGEADAAGAGVLAAASLLSAPTVARLEAWRRAGGELRLETVRVGRGGFTGSATGRLGLDDAHRPAGELDAALLGFEPYARQLGIPMAGVQLGGLLASVLGGRTPSPAARGAIHLPLTLADGQLQLGPFPLGVRLAPLY